MRKALVATLLVSMSMNSLANDESIFGTHWVRFQEVRSAGSLTGCQLTFLTVIADRVYLGGNPVAVNGSIALMSGDRSLGLMLKIGVKDLASPSSSFAPPHFAYLQAGSASTAKLRQNVAEGDPGYKLFIYSATDDGAMDPVIAMLTTGDAQIGYNRSAGGMDVMASVDLTVSDSQYAQGRVTLRKRSLEPKNGFSDCIQQVINNLTAPGK